MVNRSTCVFFALFLAVGCSGPQKQLPSEQIISEAQAKSKKMEIQERLISQAGRATLTASKDYRVGPEDLLEVTFFGNDELGREVRVSGGGDITLPLVGAVQVAGLTSQETETRLVQIYKERKFIRNPQITVSVKEYRHQRVMVSGAVTTPGSYEMIGPRTLLEILGKAGGLSDKPEMKAGDLVYVIRYQGAPALMKAGKEAPAQPFAPGSNTVVIDLRRLLTGGSPELNILINGGDVIYVPPARMAYVLGAVKKPGQVAVKDNLTVTQAVALAEGLDTIVASNNVSVIRFDDQGQRIILSVNLKGVTTGAEPDPLVKENDIVYIQESGFRRFMYDFKNFLPGSFGASIPMF